MEKLSLWQQVIELDHKRYDIVRDMLRGSIGREDGIRERERIIKESNRLREKAIQSFDEFMQQATRF